MSPDAAVIEDIAAELGVSPAFVEKDWYSVQVLKSIAEHQNDSIETIFSGGTCLSKGHGLIQRFSEDLDFRCRYIAPGNTSQNRKFRSAYRSELVRSIQATAHIKYDQENLEIASNYIKFPLGYPQHYHHPTALRPNLQIEFSFTQPRLPAQRKPIQSWVAKLSNGAAETDILCLSPIETAADKLSALTWRVLKRDRNNDQDDPAMIRHLHDLCALSGVIEAENDLFVETTRAAFDEDQQTEKRKTETTLLPSLQSVWMQLRDDALYRHEYQQFVDAMSYADDADKIEFDRALANLEMLIAQFDN